MPEFQFVPRAQPQTLGGGFLQVVNDVSLPSSDRLEKIVKLFSLSKALVDEGFPEASIIFVKPSDTAAKGLDFFSFAKESFTIEIVRAIVTYIKEVLPVADQDKSLLIKYYLNCAIYRNGVLLDAEDLLHLIREFAIDLNAQALTSRVPRYPISVGEELLCASTVWVALHYKQAMVSALLEYGANPLQIENLVNQATHPEIYKKVLAAKKLAEAKKYYLEKNQLFLSSLIDAVQHNNEFVLKFFAIGLTLSNAQSENGAKYDKQDYHYVLEMIKCYAMIVYAKEHSFTALYQQVLQRLNAYRFDVTFSSPQLKLFDTAEAKDTFLSTPLVPSLSELASRADAESAVSEAAVVVTTAPAAAPATNKPIVHLSLTEKFVQVMRDGNLSEENRTKAISHLLQLSRAFIDHGLPELSINFLYETASPFGCIMVNSNKLSESSLLEVLDYIVEVFPASKENKLHVVSECCMQYICVNNLTGVHVLLSHDAFNINHAYNFSNAQSQRYGYAHPGNPYLRLHLPLIYAVARQSVALTHVFLLHGADPDCLDESNNAATMAATSLPQLSQEIKAARHLLPVRKGSASSDEVLKRVNDAMKEDIVFVRDYIKTVLNCALAQAKTNAAYDKRNYRFVFDLIRDYGAVAVSHAMCQKYKILQTLPKEAMALLEGYPVGADMPADLKLFRTEAEKNQYCDGSLVPALKPDNTITSSAQLLGVYSVVLARKDSEAAAAEEESGLEEGMSSERRNNFPVEEGLTAEYGYSS